MLFGKTTEKNLSKDEFEKLYQKRLDRYNNRESLNKEINAKYDAELAALETQAPQEIIPQEKPELKDVKSTSDFIRSNRFIF